MLFAALSCVGPPSAVTFNLTNQAEQPVVFELELNLGEELSLADEVIVQSQETTQVEMALQEAEAVLVEMVQVQVDNDLGWYQPHARLDCVYLELGDQNEGELDCTGDRPFNQRSDTGD